jgi:membrane protease YdiL (CAAX protease family)
MFSRIRNWLSGHSLTTFLALAFGYTWTFQILLAGFAPDQAQRMNNFRLAVYGPTLAALLVPLIASGPKGLGNFLRSRLAPRGNPIWYGMALFMIPTLLLLVRGIHFLAFPELQLEMPVLRDQVGNILMGFLAALTFGPLAEELGWRGFALPELQKRLNPLLASLVLGLIWWTWHLPSLLIPTYQWAVGGMPILLYLILIMPGSVLAAWIYNNSRGSALPAILFHGSMNFSMSMLSFNSPYFLPFVVGGLWLCAGLIVLGTGADLTVDHDKKQAWQFSRTASA